MWLGRIILRLLRHQKNLLSFIVCKNRLGVRSAHHKDSPVGPDHGMSLEAEYEGLGDGADGGQGPGQAQQQPGEPRGGAVQDREHRGAEPGQEAWADKIPGKEWIPVNRYCHEDIPGDEVAEDPEENHHLAGHPVCPPRDRGCPGNLQRNANQNNLDKTRRSGINCRNCITYDEVSTREVDEEQHHPVLVVEDQPLPEQVEEGAEVGHQPHHQLNTVHRYRDHICVSEPNIKLYNIDQ